MADTVFTPGTPIVSPWLNDVNTLVYGLPASSLATNGAGLVGYNVRREYLFGTVGRKLQEIKSVKDYGALGDGVNDDSSAIREALLACLPSTPTYSLSGIDYYVAKSSLYFPPGRYLVSSTISITASLGPTKKVTGLCIFGPESTPVYAGGSSSLNAMAATIIANSASSWAADQAVFDLQYLQYSTIKGLAVRGISGTTKAFDFSNSVGWGYENCAVYSHKYGYFHSLSSGIHFRNNAATNCTHVGLYLSNSGDSDIDSAFLNTNDPDHTASTSQGVGFYCATSNNTNFRGGKVEFNSIGISLVDTQGINITGVNFDCNYQCHILANYTSVSGLTPNSLQLKSIQIVGNRFLAGGFATGTVQKAHINIYSGTSNTNFVIVGNAFRKGSGLAFDENTGGAQAVGPSTYCVYVDHQGNSTYTNTFACTGNDFYNGSETNTIGVSAPNGANVSFLGTNVLNLPHFKSGAGIFLFEASDMVSAATGTYIVKISDRDIFTDFAGTVTITLPSASLWRGRSLQIWNNQPQLALSATSNVIPRTGGSAGTAILPAVDGAWTQLISDGTNWRAVGGS